MKMSLSVTQNEVWMKDGRHDLAEHRPDRRSGCGREFLMEQADELLHAVTIFQLEGETTHKEGRATNSPMHSPMQHVPRKQQRRQQMLDLPEQRYWRPVPMMALGGVLSS